MMATVIARMDKCDNCGDYSRHDGPPSLLSVDALELLAAAPMAEEIGRWLC